MTETVPACPFLSYFSKTLVGKCDTRAKIHQNSSIFAKIEHFMAF